MNVANDIIVRFGGITRLARALGHRWPTTVQGWKDRGVIPITQIPKVIAAAEETGIKVDPLEFLQPSNPDKAA